jgi:shikimate dehydrogenase
MERLGLGVEALPELLTAAERTGLAGVNVNPTPASRRYPAAARLSKDARALAR